MPTLRQVLAEESMSISAAHVCVEMQVSVDLCG